MNWQNRVLYLNCICICARQSINQKTAKSGQKGAPCQLTTIIKCQLGRFLSLFSCCRSLLVIDPFSFKEFLQNWKNLFRSWASMQHITIGNKKGFSAPEDCAFGLPYQTASNYSKGYGCVCVCVKVWNRKTWSTLSHIHPWCWLSTKQYWRNFFRRSRTRISREKPNNVKRLASLPIE